MEIGAPVLSLLYSIAKDCAKLVTASIHVDEAYSKQSIHKHIIEIKAWSEKFQFLGMAKAKSTETDSLPLRISTSPRRYASQRNAVIKTESQLLADKANIILLGDPGSGKTTTAKRIIRSIVHDEETDANKHIEFPILIVARDMESGDTLTMKIASILGARYELPDNKKVNRQTEGDLQQKRFDMQEFVFSFLEKAKILLLIDGIDELPSRLRKTLENELSKISKRLLSGQIIATCRSGDFGHVIEGFDLVEILPLNEEEIKSIVALWTSKSDEFFDKIDRTGYKDLLNKPLYLCQIVLIFDEWGDLPQKPSEVCRRVITLMLEKWDRERRITRNSKYAKFTPEQKMDFIANVAYDLSYHGHRKTSFREGELIAIYAAIYERFGLPREQAVQVVDEIESHSGLIVQTSYDSYQFSHLSIQEYLAAHHIVRQPNITRALDLLYNYPPPIAIAVCLSSDSSEYFAEIIFGLFENKNRDIDDDELLSFLYRLNEERPQFREDVQLGGALLILIERFDKVSTAQWRAFTNTLAQDAVRRSLTSAIYFYDMRKSQQRIDRNAQITLNIRKEVSSNVPRFRSSICLNSSSLRFIGAAN